MLTGNHVKGGTVSLEDESTLLDSREAMATCGVSGDEQKMFCKTLLTYRLSFWLEAPPFT